MNDLQYKLFLALVILFSNFVSRDILLGDVKEKCDDICKKNKNLMSFLLVFCILFSFTRDIETTFIGLGYFCILKSL
jgi:hypothetical protein